MAGRDVNVQMGLTSVDEVSFMMLPGKVTENVQPGNIKLGFFNQVQPEVESDKIALIFGVRYELEDDKILECVYRFEFRVNGLDRFITTHDKDGITVTYIMPLLINVARNLSCQNGWDESFEVPAPYNRFGSIDSKSVQSLKLAD